MDDRDYPPNRRTLNGAEILVLEKGASTPNAVPIPIELRRVRRSRFTPEVVANAVRIIEAAHAQQVAHEERRLAILRETRDAT
jgi:hypothetical protein